MHAMGEKRVTLLIFIRALRSLTAYHFKNSSFPVEEQDIIGNMAVVMVNRGQKNENVP